ncbi:MAG: DUF192 domain-containing protein [Alphaproteobacteria bacterium]|nr:DUF192 domain-containing protein [Alphaproteobacteria bacterium]
MPIIILLAVLVLSGAATALETFPTTRLAISSAGKTHVFTVELATTRSQRAQGLMWRTRLAPDRGMLFVYGHEQVLSMWMKNTLIPLDMLFIDHAGAIVRIHERAVPRSLRAISSGKRARAVLELNGGTASRLGLKPGDRVLHKALGTR